MKKILKFVFAGMLVAFLIFTIDWRDVVENIIGANLFFVGLFVLFYIIGIAISARKWKALACHVNFVYPYRFYIETYILGTFLNNFLPSFVGGDAYRTVRLGGSEKRLADSFATVMLDRISGLVMIIFLAAFLGMINFTAMHESAFVQLMLIILCLLILSLFFFLALFKTVQVQKCVRVLPKKIQKYIGILGRFRERAVVKESLKYSFEFSIFGIAIANYMLFLAVGIDISLVDYMSVVFITNLIASLPISIGNIGTKEWAYITLFGIFGVGSSALVAVVLISRFLQMVVSLTALPLYFQQKGLLKKLQT